MVRPLPERIVFMGTPAFAVSGLTALLSSGARPVGIYTQPDKPAGRKRVLTAPPVKVVADRERLPLFQPKNLKEPLVVETIKGLKPDVITVVAYGKLLPGEILEIPRLGCVNVHASLLPRHRGASPVAHAILAGDALTGISTMKMDKGLDTGPVYLQRELLIPEGATAGSLSAMLAELGADLLIATLEGLEAGIIEPTTQVADRATVAPRLCVEGGKLDFRRPARELERQVRAFLPWPGTFFVARGARVKVLESRVAEDTQPGHAPGDLVPGKRLGIVCGDGAVLFLDRVQRESKRPMASEEFLRGISLPPQTNVQEAE